jgi:pimeloyl-ACP methyl ester carboxylesterase
VIQAPNRDAPPRVVRNLEFGQKVAQRYARSWEINVGPPAAVLTVAVIEPGDYQLDYNVSVKTNSAGRKQLATDIDWTLPDPAKQTPIRPKGTLLILHGYRDAKENVLHWGIALAQEGYRCVLVDFRGHGQSTGEVISYGAFETGDLKRVIDDLEQKGLFTHRSGVLGVSNGASVEPLLASPDHRVKTVVALEPYSRAATGVVEFARGVAPSRTADISDATFQKGLDQAEILGGFQWADADVLDAMKTVKAPVFLMHGKKDQWISLENSRQLLKLAPKRSKLMTIAGRQPSQPSAPSPTHPERRRRMVSRTPAGSADVQNRRPRHQRNLTRPNPNPRRHLETKLARIAPDNQRN